MHALDVLEKVAQTLGQRGQENGYDQQEERSAGSIARIHDAITGSDAGYTKKADVWLGLIALKLARLASQRQNGSDVSDTVIDLVAYAALLAEELTSGNK